MVNIRLNLTFIGVGVLGLAFHGILGELGLYGQIIGIGLILIGVCNLVIFFKH